MGKKVQLINMKKKAVRNNIKHYRYFEATGCFLRLEFLSVGYFTLQRVRSK